MVQVHWVRINRGLQEDQRKGHLLVLGNVEIEKLVYLISWNLPFAIAE